MKKTHPLGCVFYLFEKIACTVKDCLCGFDHGSIVLNSHCLMVIHERNEERCGVEVTAALTCHFAFPVGNSPFKLLLALFCVAETDRSKTLIYGEERKVHV